MSSVTPLRQCRASYRIEARRRSLSHRIVVCDIAMPYVVLLTRKRHKTMRYNIVTMSFQNVVCAQNVTLQCIIATYPANISNSTMRIDITLSRVVSQCRASPLMDVRLHFTNTKFHIKQIQYPESSDIFLS